MQPPLQNLLRILVWSAIVAIFVVTDGPIELRPSIGASANADRLIAFAGLGFLFAISYPSRIIAAFCVLALVVLASEFLQLRDLGRHARVSDVLVKMLGAAFGIGCGALVNYVLHSRSAKEPTAQASRTEV